jgi:pyruvate,water dikinase
MTTISWFESYWAGMKSEVGGKAASLGEMTGAGLPVPPGFAITTSAYRRARDEADLDAQVARILHGLDINDTDSVTERCTQIRRLISTMPIPEGIELQIKGAYLELAARCGTKELPVAVRSSATSEDSPDASFAGEHDTYLWVRGAEDVIDAVRRCWASLFTDRATCYRVEMGYDHRSVEMSVVVQKMVRPKAAGVAFTLNPVDGDRSQVAIDSAWGFGEAVVSGEVTPDNFLVDKVMKEIGRRTISVKECEFRLSDHDTVEKVPLDPERAAAPSLTDDEIRAIATLARTAERHYGSPQDIEWAVDADLPDGANVILLQARPETVWSKKVPGVSPVAKNGDFMASIVSTLMSPLYSKDRTTTPEVLQHDHDHSHDHPHEQHQH